MRLGEGARYPFPMVPLILLALCAAEVGTQPIQVLPSVDAAFPPAGTLVPTNVRPIAFSSYGPPAEIAFTRVDSDGTGVEVPFETRAADGATAYLLDVGALAPAEGLTIAPACAGCSATFAWEVGDADDDNPPRFLDGEPPQVRSNGYTFGGLNPFTKGYEIDAVLPGAVDDEGPAMLRVQGDEGIDLLMSPSFSDPEEPSSVVHFFVEGGAVRTYCFRVVAIDTAGNEGAFAEELCTDFAEATERGCATSPSPPGALAALLLLFWCRRAARDSPRRRARR